LLILFLSTGNTSGKCSLHNTEYRLRPNTETYTLSPSGHFMIHYDINGIHATSQPDYIDEVGIIADSSRYVLVDLMNFLPEIPDSDGIYDIYIQDRPSGYYGVNYQDDTIIGASYIIIDNEYEVGEFFTSGINTMRLTTAHEFFHAIQRAYRTEPSLGDNYFWEMSSTWIEDLIVPNGDDYLYWVDSFFDNPEQYISDTDGYSIALFGHYLSSNFNSGSGGLSSSIIREMWEKYSEIDNALYSINYILSQNYESDFSNVWVDFNSKNLFNGIYDNTDNDFYYYSDQRYLQPLSTSINFLNQNSEVDLIFSEESAVFKTFYVNNICSISIQNNIIPSNSEYNGKIAVIAEDISLNFLTDMTDSVYYFDQGTYINLLYTGYENSIITANINYNEDLVIIDGDLNLDQEVNIQDIIVMIDFIFNNISLNQFQFTSGDINIDGSCNIFDIIIIIDIIMS